MTDAKSDQSEIPLRPKNPDPEQVEKKQSKRSKQTKSQAQNKEDLALPQARKEDTIAEAAEGSGDSPSQLPDFIVKRNELFDKLKRKHDAEVLEKEHPVINVVLDLGNDRSGAPIPAMPVAAKAWESTPGSFLKHVDKDISSDVVVAKVDGRELWDLHRPLEKDCRISYLPFTSPEGRNVFWHSSAHVLGEAAECQYNCLLSHGPPVEQGFFYDMAIAGG